MKKELKSLKRSELIEIIYQLKKSEQELQKENEALRKSLESKRISLANAGSIADAALALTAAYTAFVGAFSHHQRYTAHDDRFAGTGFAGDGQKAVFGFPDEFVYQSEVAYL